ncbi:MAG: FAD-binding oxidoreductase [Micavibrio aeruginosavorus]|uniref:FAD-binding oxidoreductase n=1 Tax=Micavibrio aeruginosavorus TaxID=349221 RepID=A0A7T5R2D4_9BACT|nr:MAG: FAD-binding oxidoreductase [Micavibrio aeruginosavorus]
MQPAGYIDTYYSRTLNDQGSFPALEGEADCDVCIVGAGLAGINTAYGLSERGQKNIVVIDEHRIGWGASGRNGGFVAKGYSAGEAELAARLGLETAQKLVGLTQRGRQIIRDRIERHQIDCGPLTPGVLTVSWRDRPGVFAAKVEEANRNFSLGLEYWPTEKVREHCRTARYFDGVFSPHDFQFHSLRYAHGLARVVRERGGKIFENTKAMSIAKEGSCWLVKTPQGAVRTKVVVVCCSIYAQGLEPRLERASFPVQTYVMVTEPLDPSDLSASINTSHAIYDTRFASDYYRVLPDRRIMWGGRVGLWAEPLDLSTLMFRDLLKVYPQLAGKTKPQMAWSGLLCYAPHKMPQIGELAPGYWYNTGFGGHGLVPTTVGGEVVAAAIAGQDQTYKLFEPFGLGYAGGKLGRYVAQMVYWGWRARDVLDGLKEARA